MPNYRLSFIFEAGTVGWSEQWYLTSSMPATGVPDQVLTNEFLAGFLKPRASGVFLQALRVNDIDVPRLSFLKVLGLSSRGFSGSQDPNGEQPSVCALGYCVTGGGKHRSVQVRGLIDSQVNRDFDDMVIWTAEIMSALKQYTNAVIAAGFAVKTLRSADGANPDRQLTTLAPSQKDSGATTLTYIGPQLLGGKMLIMHGISRVQFPGYSGPLPFYNSTLTTADVAVAWRSPALVQPVRNGTVRNAIYDLDPVASIAFDDMRTKKTGRPFLSQRGRRSGVKYRSR